MKKILIILMGVISINSYANYWDNSETKMEIGLWDFKETMKTKYAPRESGIGFKIQLGKSINDKLFHYGITELKLGQYRGFLLEDQKNGIEKEYKTHVFRASIIQGLEYRLNNYFSLLGEGNINVRAIGLGTKNLTTETYLGVYGGFKVKPFGDDTFYISLKDGWTKERTQFGTFDIKNDTPQIGVGAKIPLSKQTYLDANINYWKTKDSKSKLYKDGRYYYQPSMNMTTLSINLKHLF